jgi:hydrogenase nickel incorporation protein HypA/HybF
MHEFGLCESILEAVERRAAGRPVTRVGVRCGVFNRVDSASMRQAFALVADDSVTAAADLDLTVVPTRLECAGCGGISEVDDVVFECPRCHGLDVDLTGAQELTLVSVALARLGST